MQEARKSSYSKPIYSFVPTLPTIFLGIYLIWIQGISSSIVPITFLAILFSFISGIFMWLWHVDQLDQQNHSFQKKNKAALNQLMSYTIELERLLISVSPKIVEQVLTARELTESEITILVRRFSSIIEELQQIIDFANHVPAIQDSNSIKSLKSSAEKVRGEIDIVLEALQFQDRVSQILVQVENNLTSLKKTTEKIQSGGSDRNQSQIKVEAMLAKIESNYESVNHLPKRSASENAVDELTFF